MIREYNSTIPKNKPTIVFLSTYPPRECGIATFTQDLLSYCVKFLDSRIICKVAAFNLSPLDTYKYPPEVAWEIDQSNIQQHLDLAETINSDDNISGVILQHEYGIFGGEKGGNILAFIENCKKPLLVTLHTVLPKPPEKMRRVTKKIIKYATTIVVLTQTSKKIIEEVYPESVGKVFVIPHGIHPTSFSTTQELKTKLALENHIVLTTFGLLSRGKGIEYVINALPEVIKRYPSLLYLVLGETHPVIRRKEGEKYRIKLLQLVTKLHLENHVKFYDQYLGLPDLFQFLKATDIYIATSTNPNQAVSGTLSYALGAGRAVISTDFAQAKELVTPELGRLIPIKDSPALTSALLDLLSDKKRLKQMHLKAYENTRSMLWSNVAKDYTNLLSRTVLPPLNLGHLRTMTDDFGLFQFAAGTVPDKKFGYTIDDNARALIVCCWLIKQKHTKELEALITLYLKFIKKCLLKDGSFTNYIAYHDKAVTNQNHTENLEDCQGRVLWALSEVINNKVVSKKIRDTATKLFLNTLKEVPQLTFLRTRAFAIKALAVAYDSLPDHRKEILEYIHKHAIFLLQAIKHSSFKSWIWFEDYLSYNNAALPEALFIAGSLTKNTKYTEKGKQTLQFLIDKTFSSNIYLAIGQSHWYKNNQKRSQYDQQPEDPASMILALATAYKSTHNEEYKLLAERCFGWFLGKNSINQPLYDSTTGGCHDGLLPNGVNPNEGAESLIAYLMSSITVKELH